MATGTPFHTSVSLRGFHFEMAHLTVNLAAGITIADINKAVTVDTSGSNKFKLAGDGDTVVGRLEVVEDRKVEGQLIGTVSFQFANTIPFTGTLAAGDTVVGSATPGVVKKAAAADYSKNFVAEIIGTNAVVVKI